MNSAAPMLARAEYEARLRETARVRYHDTHPFHLRMHAGELDKRQLQAWVVNRYYYQTCVPIKDALILSKMPDPAWRRRWIRRIHDHDGEHENEGGLFLWLKLAEGVGLDPAAVRRCEDVLPAVRFACDAYVTLVRERPLIEAVASSLTELFAPDLMESRIEAWKRHYPWVDTELTGYFRSRPPKARYDAQEALDFVMDSAESRAEQERCLQAFTTKCEVLWSLLDAVDHAFPSRETSAG